MTNIVCRTEFESGESGATPAERNPGRPIRVALAGNPNTGKTTLFNLLTGARQRVANYPGVTVEKFEGRCRWEGTEMAISDLPGMYGLTAYSLEERVARRELIEGEFDVVVAVADASNLRRHLYLAVQIIELGAPLVVALNMADVARRQGIEFDLALIERRLGVPVVPLAASKGEGKADLLECIARVARENAAHGEDASRRAGVVHHSEEAEREIALVEDAVVEAGATFHRAPSRWIAQRLIENDEEVSGHVNHEGLLRLAADASGRLESALGDNPEALFAERTHACLGELCRQAVATPVHSRRSVSERADSVLTHRFLGLPLFLGLMYLVFHLTFTLGEAPMGWIENAFALLGMGVSSLWPAGSESLLRSLMVDGVIGGVGGVLVFLPNIVLLFLAIAVLEDSGYMARAAFLMDRLMHKIGLHGKSFIPMLIGFGCSVPAIMATRALEHRKDRMITMLVTPLMSCGARLPIYALLIPAFFPEAWRGVALWSVYLIGIGLAVLCAKLLRTTLFKGDTPPFVMELPPYRIPTLRNVLLHMTNRCGAYLKKAGTVILGISIVLWALAQWPSLSSRDIERFEAERQAIAARPDLAGESRDEALAEVSNREAEAALETSAVGRLGRIIEPPLRPCGFDWKISTAMIGAFAAKEVFVAQMGVVHALGNVESEGSPSLRARLRAAYSPLQAYSVMLFCLISAPCMATIAVTRRESDSWKWALFQLFGLTALAWVVAAFVYQVGRLIGIGA